MLQQQQPDQSLRIALIADTHMLGPYRGHWLDKLRREWQMSTAYYFMQLLHQPNSTFFLGDVFDEGQHVNSAEYDEYFKRFQRLFPKTSSDSLQVVTGNHDVGFHYRMNKNNLKRFYKSFNTSSCDIIKIGNVTFITINSMAMEQDGCNICEEAERKIQSIAAKLAPNDKPILLQHFPLFRSSDDKCMVDDCEDCAPEDEKIVAFREKMDCLSLRSSRWLLKLLHPRVVFSGHTHHYCLIDHDGIYEYSVPSLNWRNRDNPSYFLVTVSRDDYAVYKCLIPRESSVYKIYAMSMLFFISILSVILYRKCKQETRLKIL